MNRIYVVEDDQSIYTELTTLLNTNGYMVVEEEPYDLVLMDINLPKESGFALCQRIRRSSDVPIIILTARDTSEDEILAFGVGADDFLRKPYNSAVLLARIARLLKATNAAIMTVRELTLNLSDMAASYQGQSVELTKNEMRILACLMKKDVCTRTEIVEDLWRNSVYIDENALYVNIGRLREKLATIGANEYVRTIRGVGYRL